MRFVYYVLVNDIRDVEIRRCCWHSTSKFWQAKNWHAANFSRPETLLLLITL